jgi:hypothetical protein
MMKVELKLKGEVVATTEVKKGCKMSELHAAMVMVMPDIKVTEQLEVWIDGKKKLYKLNPDGSLAF